MQSDSAAQNPTPKALAQPNVDPQVKTMTSTDIIPEVPYGTQNPDSYFSPSVRASIDGLKTAENPAEYIRKTFGSMQDVVNSHIQSQVDNAAAKTNFVPPVQPASVAPSPAPEPQKTEPPSAAQPEPTPAPDAPTDAPKPTIEDNYKILRTKHKETTEALRALEQEREALKTKVTKYETGEELPEVVKQLQTRVSELEPLEHVHNLKRSPAYHEKYVKPLASLSTKLSELAKDYDLPAHVMEEAVDLTNRADLNRFLVAHLDEVGALEAKNIISDIQRVRGEAKSAESNARQTLETLTAEHKQMQEALVAERKNKIVGTARSAWDQAVTGVRAEKKLNILVPRENDPDFNEKYPKAITERAASEYGKLVTALAESGLEVLPEDAAKALANFALYAVAGTVAAAEADALRAYAQELHTNTERTNGMIRPSIGANGGAGGGLAPESGPPRMSPSEVGQWILENKVLPNARR